MSPTERIRRGIRAWPRTWTRWSSRHRTLLGLVLGTPALLALLVLLLGPVSWLVAGDTVRGLDGREQAEALNRVRQTVLSAAGGAAVLFGLGYTARTYHLSRRGQLTERFSTAIGQLASERLEERVGAVYGLEHVMVESPQEHATVVAVLTTFVRERAPRERAPRERADGGADDEAAAGAAVDSCTEPPADVQAAVDVLARRPEREETRRLDLRRTGLARLLLRGFEFADPPRLSRAYLTWADLRRADLRDADLRDAILNFAQLRQAMLAGARLDDAALWRADLRGAHLDRTRLHRADLRAADLTDVRALTAEQLSTAVLDGETRLSPDLATDPWVVARLDDCAACRTTHDSSSTPPPTARP